MLQIEKLFQKKKYILPIAILIAIGMFINLFTFIPTWKHVQTDISLTTFAISAFLGLVFLIIIHTKYYLRKKKLKFKNCIGFILDLLILFSSIVFMFSFSLILLAFSSFNTFNPEKSYKWKDITIYQYKDIVMCFPDPPCSCDSYYSEIYIEDAYFPIMDLEKRVDFYIDTIIKVDNTLIIKAGECDRDIGKEVKVEL